MGEALLVPLSFSIAALFVISNDIKKLCIIYSSLFMVAVVLGYTLFYGLSSYYKFQFIMDIMYGASALILQCKWKRNALIIICALSAAMNLYEELSYYQTFIYPYRYWIQFILTQLLLVIILFNTKMKLIR